MPADKKKPTIRLAVGSKLFFYELNSAAGSLCRAWNRQQWKSIPWISAGHSGYLS